MNPLEKLKQLRVAALQKAEDLNAKSVNGVLSAEDQTSFDAAMSEIEKLDADISAEQAKMDAAAKAAQNADRLQAMRQTTAPRTVARSHEAVVTNVRERREDDRSRGFASFASFAMDVARAGMGHAPSHLLNPLAAGLGVNQAVGSEGGFLVPPQFSTTIWDGLNNSTESLMSMCDQYPIESESLTLLANAETSRANGSRYGGIQANWVAEAAQIARSKPTFRNLKLEPHGLAALVYVTEKMMRNPGALNQYLTRAAIDEINFVVGDSIINGNGSGQPLGIMNSGALVTVAKEGSQATGTLLQANISKMWARLHPRCRKNAVWFYNVDVEPQLDGLNVPIKNVAGTENVGGIGNNVYNAEKGTLKGRPIMPIEYCASLSSLGDIILADMSMYAVGTQGGISSDVSMHLRFDYAEQAFRFLMYVDGQPWLAAPQTPYKGANTLSSFVTLQAR